MTTQHLDVEALSASLDGAATGAEQAHLATCPQCRAQLESLAAVARAVGAGVAPRPSAEVDAAVAQALAAWTPATPRGDIRDTDQRVPVAPVVPIARLGRRSRRWLATGAGIAAALILVVGVVALARGTSPKTVTSATAAGPAATTPPPTAALPSSGTVLGGDLGDQSDPSAVARLVVGALSAAGAGATNGSVNASASGAAPGLASPSTAAAASSCVAQAQASLGLAVVSGAGAGVRYQATVVWQGRTPAVVVVFSPPDGLKGAVMKAADCSLLAVLPL